MNEAARCDRVSLMEAGRVLATDTPPNLVRARHAATLENAFVSYLEEANGTRTTLALEAAKGTELVPRSLRRGARRATIQSAADVRLHRPRNA